MILLSAATALHSVVPYPCDRRDLARLGTSCFSFGYYSLTMSSSPSVALAAVVAGAWLFAVGLVLEAVGLPWWAGAFLAGLTPLPVVTLLHRARGHT